MMNTMNNLDKSHQIAHNSQRLEMFCKKARESSFVIVKYSLEHYEYLGDVRIFFGSHCVAKRDEKVHQLLHLFYFRVFWVLWITNLGYYCPNDASLLPKSRGNFTDEFHGIIAIYQTSSNFCRGNSSPFQSFSNHSPNKFTISIAISRKHHCIMLWMIHRIVRCCLPDVCCFHL